MNSGEEEDDRSSRPNVVSFMQALGEGIFRIFSAVFPPNCFAFQGMLPGVADSSSSGDDDSDNDSCEEPVFSNIVWEPFQPALVSSCLCHSHKSLCQCHTQRKWHAWCQLGMQ